MTTTIESPRAAADALSLDGHPAAADPVLAELAGAALAAADDALRAASAPHGGEAPYAARQGVLLELVVSGVAAAVPERRGAYAAFHRDWLIRWPVLQNGMGLGKAQQVLALLGAQAAQMGSPGMEVLEGSLGTHVPAAERAEWDGALRDVARYAAERGDDPAFTRADPFTADPAFPLLLRLLHGAARRLGVKLLDEAFLHHLVAAAGGGAQGEFCLAPHLQSLPDPPPAEARPQGGTSFEEGYDWRALVARSGDEGRAWAETYAVSERAIGRALDHGLRVLRQGGIQEGAELLAQVREHRDGLRETNPGAYHVLGRFYHGQKAYYEYLLGNLDEAEREMDEAAASIRDALETHGFLLPVAPLIVDIPLQKARIARRERDWPLMARRLEEMLAMEMEAQPLCVLSDGREIGYPTLRGFFAGMEMEPARRVGVDRVLNRDDRLREFRRLTTRLYALPGLVTPS